LRPCTLPGVGVACYASCMTFLFTMPLRIIQVHERPTAKTAPPPRPDLNLEVSLLVDYQFIKCKKNVIDGCLDVTGWWEKHPMGDTLKPSLIASIVPYWSSCRAQY
jgi:hypothetical protein